MKFMGYNSDFPYNFAWRFAINGLCDNENSVLRCTNSMNYADPVLDSIISEFEGNTNFVERKEMLEEINGSMNYSMMISDNFNCLPTPNSNRS